MYCAHKGTSFKTVFRSSLMKEISLSNRDDEKREIDLFDLKFIEKKMRECS